MSKLNSLRDLFVEELQILLSGEEQLAAALPKLAAAASATELREGFERHWRQTKGHAEKLRGLLGKLGAPTEAKFCPAMAGLIKAGEGRMALQAPGVVRDAALIVAGQRVEHFELAGYGSARTYAGLLGHGDLAGVLEEIEQEEADTDQALSALAETLNGRALVATA